MGPARAAEGVVDAVHDQAGVLGPGDPVAGRGEPPSRSRVARRVGVARRAEPAGDDTGEVPPLEAHDQGEQEEEDQRRHRVGGAHDGAELGQRDDEAQRLPLELEEEGFEGVAGPQLGAGACAALEHSADDAETGTGEEHVGGGAQKEFEYVTTAAGGLAASSDPPCPGQQGHRQEQVQQEARCGQQPDAPHPHHGPGPGRFGAAGLERVGKDAGGVEAVGGSDEALLVDMELLDHPVAVRGVEIGAGAQQPARFAQRRVYGSSVVRSACHRFPLSVCGGKT